MDTLPPVVEIINPTSDQKFLLNAPLHVEFTAKDPPQDGAGTGIGAVRASISGCGGSYNVNITDQLTVNPALPQAADITVNAQADLTAGAIGSFTITAEADDQATPEVNTGSATANFSVGVNWAVLPPISVPNRQFKTGSTVPIKWSIADANGFLPPFTNIKITIITPSGSSEDRFAGAGAANIRWDLDESGNATQYITNYQIPETPATGMYTVKILLVDACVGYAEQGTFTFNASTKGGKN